MQFPRPNDNNRYYIHFSLETPDGLRLSRSAGWAALPVQRYAALLTADKEIKEDHQPKVQSAPTAGRDPQDYPFILELFFRARINK
jgi:hypothetical protein